MLKAMAKEIAPGIYVLETEKADIWVAQNTKQKDVDYFYGGTRTVPSNYDDEKTERVIEYLEKYESGMKNTLINKAIGAGIFDEYKESLPVGFIGSCVGGGRCVIHPNNSEVEKILLDPNHSKHKELVDELFKELGEFLDDLNGKIKLTPDFGRFAGLADMLHNHTNNVLGIACDEGGCGGKASYTSTGIIQAVKTLGIEDNKDIPVTLIGSAGACGEGVLKYILDNNFTDVAVCDLWYEDAGKNEAQELRKNGVKVLKSENGMFTDECLSRGGYIIATTVGRELTNSNVDSLQDGTILLLAHNEALPVGKEGIDYIDALLEKRNVLIIPGQLLTFGGALTSRIEWFWRKNNPATYFDKKLAHSMVSVAMDFWIQKVATVGSGQNIYKKMYEEYAS